MKFCFTRFFRGLSLVMLAFSLSVEASSFASSTVRLSGHIPSEGVASAIPLGSLETATPIPLTFTLPLRNQEALELFLQRIYDPADAHYGKYLTSEEFIEQFAPTQEDYEKVIAYANNLGFTVSNQHPNRVLLNVLGTAQTVENAFNLHLHYYQKQNGRKFYAPNDNPEVDVSIASIISSIVGLDNHAVWHPQYRQKEIKNSPEELGADSHAFPSGPGGGFAPNDIITAYELSGVSVKGAGQVIALFELAKYQASDINFYANHFGLPSPNLVNVLVDGGSGDGIDAEVTLDIELALALAPQSRIYVYEGPNTGQGVLDTYNRIATDNIAKQISTSWGIGENLESEQYLRAENTIFLQMATQGQTIYAAAGDSGAYDDYPPSKTLVVDDPASQPYVVGIGGTHLSVNSQTGVYESESVWNNGLNNGAGGGGVSQVWPIPAWQTKVSTTYSKTQRNVPDFALNADPNTGYSIYHNSQWVIFGGTSCAAPLWAAFTARVNQKRVALKKPVLGFANPLLYTIATGALYKGDFHDVVTGNNLFYNAHVGYDNASGWGSFNGINLFNSLTTPPPPPHQVTPPSQFVGKVVKNVFATKTTYSHVLTWKPSPDPTVVNYKIFLKGQVVAQVPAKGPYKVTLTNRNPNITYIYTLEAFDSKGNKSKPLTVTLPK